MFTGIIEELGRVAAIETLGDSVRLTIAGPLVVSDVHRGDSIAVNGTCLTAVEFDTDGFTADVMQETLNRTSLAGLKVGDPVNLERAMTAATRFGGHVVQGHVDGVGQIIGRATDLAHLEHQRRQRRARKSARLGRGRSPAPAQTRRVV